MAFCAYIRNTHRISSPNCCIMRIYYIACFVHINPRFSYDTKFPNYVYTHLKSAYNNLVNSFGIAGTRRSFSFQCCQLNKHVTRSFTVEDITARSYCEFAYFKQTFRCRKYARSQLYSFLLPDVTMVFRRLKLLHSFICRVIHFSAHFQAYVLFVSF